MVGGKWGTDRRQVSREDGHQHPKVQRQEQTNGNNQKKTTQLCWETSKKHKKGDTGQRPKETDTPGDKCREGVCHQQCWETNEVEGERGGHTDEAQGPHLHSIEFLAVLHYYGNENLKILTSNCHMTCLFSVLALSFKDTLTMSTRVVPIAHQPGPQTKHSNPQSRTTSVGRLGGMEPETSHNSSAEISPIFVSFHSANFFPLNHDYRRF